MRAFPALLLTALLVLLLAACGGNDEDDEPTAEPAQPTQAAATTAVEPSPTLDATPGTPVVATPVASPAASPVASPAASPVASPVMAATPAASGAGIVAPPGETGDAGPTQVLMGTVSLPGTVNERFVLAGDGCVGLGTYAGLQAGQQVVVRNETGVIVGVTELAATESTTVCAWTFEVEVPSSPFYAVSLPMVGEHVYTAGEVENGDGRIELVLP